MQEQITGIYWAANGKLRLQLSFRPDLRKEVVTLLEGWKRVGTGFHPDANETILLFEERLENVIYLVERKKIHNQKIIINLQEAK